MKKKIILLCLLYLLNYFGKAQEVEPRAYAALPKNLNTLAVGYGLTRGNVLVDPALPVYGLKVTAHNITAGYLRTFGFAGKLARIQLNVPYIYVVGKFQAEGTDISVYRNGLGDARVRFGMNIIGEPVLDKKEFVHYTEKTIIGTSFLISIPTGNYHVGKRFSIGSHRWGFKPEVGISKRFKRVYAETYAGVWFYTNNNEYFGNKVLDQKPVFTIQAHGSYYFKNKMMVSLNSTWFSGGRSYVDDVESGDQLNNFRLGATWSFSIARGQTFKLQFHTGALTATGYDYNAIALVYQYVF